MQWTHTRGSGIKMSDVRQRQCGRAWGPEGGRARWGGRPALLITISQQTHERPEGPRQPCGNEESLIIFYWTFVLKQH